MVIYLPNKQMQVKYNDAYSSTYSLPGGGPQGTLVGLIEYFIQINDNAACVDQEMRFKYVDDLTVLEMEMFGTWLSEYNFKQAGESSAQPQAEEVSLKFWLVYV